MQTEPFEFFTGDYVSRLDDLRRRAIQAEQEAEKERGTARVGDDNPALQAINAEYQALKAEAEESAIRGVLQAVGRSEWRELKKNHPPRTEGDEDTVKGDRTAGVNLDSVEDDLVYASVVEPEFKNRKAFEEWADQLSAGEWQSLATRAYFLTRGVGADPKSLPASLTSSSDATSD